MQRTGAKWTATGSSVLCSISPLNVSKRLPLFHPSSVYISNKRSKRLVRGAVSTIFLSAAAVATAEVADYESAPTSSFRKRPAAAESSSRKRTAAEFPETATNKRSAVEKRERAQVWQIIIIKRKKS